MGNHVVQSDAALRQSAPDLAPASGVAQAREIVLEAVNLKHAFGRVVVLDGLGFRLARGEIFGLLGPNGCGKSTALRILTGMLVPDAGELHWLGRAVVPGARALRNHTGVVFQSSSLDQRLSVRENLVLTARLHRLADKLAAARVSEALEFAQLAERAADPVAQLSGGMKRRLELARALVHEPELLLLDEPTTGLDEVSYRRTWERILTLRDRRQLSVLLTTHRAEEAAQCDRVAIIDRGRVLALDAPDALIAHVAGDVLTLELSDARVLEQAISTVQARFGVYARALGSRLVVECERGHELVPRLVEALGPGSVRTLSMHRPTLADVFVKLTGRSLASDDDGGVRPE